MTQGYSFDAEGVRKIREVVRQVLGETSTTPPWRPKGRRVTVQQSSLYYGPWQGTAVDAIASGATATVTADAWPSPTEREAQNCGFAVAADDPVLIWRIPVSQGEDGASEDVYICLPCPPSCYGLKKFFGVPDTYDYDRVPLFTASGCTTETIEDCPSASPPAAPGDPIYYETYAEVPAATGFYNGQIAYVTNDGANTGQWMATGGAPDEAATSWTKL